MIVAIHMSFILNARILLQFSLFRFLMFKDLFRNHFCHSCHYNGAVLLRISSKSFGIIKNEMCTTIYEEMNIRQVKMEALA